MWHRGEGGEGEGRGETYAVLDCGVGRASLRRAMMRARIGRADSRKCMVVTLVGLSLVDWFGW